MKLKYRCSIVAIFFLILIVHGEESISGDSGEWAVALAIDNSVSTNGPDSERKISIVPIYETPHISITSEVQLDQMNCDLLKYTITVINDGNEKLGPVYVRDTFPADTKFLEASIQPFDLGLRYANWSIEEIPVASSVTIEIELVITARRDDYINHVNALTVEQYEVGGETREKRIRAVDSSVLEPDWSRCGPQIISASFTATPIPDQPNLLAYLLVVRNFAEEDMRFDITATMPEGMMLVESMYPTSEIIEDQISWTVEKLPPGGRRSIYFTAEPEGDGLYAMRATVRGSSVDGQKLASIHAGISTLVGEFAADVYKTEEDDWLLCDEVINASNLDGCAIRPRCDLRSGII